MARSPGNLRDMTQIALMVALLTVSAWLMLPVGPVPVTLQTFGVFGALGLLGGRRGTTAVGVYLFAGLLGLPVFSGFQGGPGVLLGATGGYLLGFLFSALTYWAVTARLGTKRPVMILSMVLGLLVCYAFGTAWCVLVYTGGGESLLSALTLCVFPYVVPDLVKIGLAVAVTERVGKVIHAK